MKDHNIVLELGFALARGDVGLWVGPEGLPLGGDTKNEVLADQLWLGVWSESKESDFAHALEANWRKQAAARMVIEVPDLVEDALGEHFKFSDFCPFFYLNGKDKSESRLSSLRREDSKREKIRFLEKLGGSVLLICGYSDAASVRGILEREIGEYGAGLRLIILAGCAGPGLQRLKLDLEDPRPALAEKIVGTEFRVPRLLQEIEENKKALPAEPTILVGRSSIQLRPLLRTQPPFDQDFTIVTEQDVRNPEPQEDKPQMLADLLAGHQPPWRAFAHGYDWKRNLPQLKHVFNGLDKMRKDGLSIYCLNIPSEPGAGLTTLLQQIAFTAARRGHPCLLHRPFGSELNYDLLRKFLTDLHHQARENENAPPPPAVLIFDTPSVEGDSKSLLQDLPVRLDRDGLRALIIRGMPVQQGANPDDISFQQLYSVRTRSGVAEDWLEAVSGELTSEEQDNLATWAKKHFEQTGQQLPEASLETIRNWNAEEQQVPLLICLYFILTDEFRAKAGLGKHLVERLKKIMPVETQSEDDVARRSRPLSREELLEAFSKPKSIGGQLCSKEKASRSDISSAFIALASLGCLRIGTPRDVLDTIAGIFSDRLLSAVILLEKNDLALTDLPTDEAASDGYSKHSDDRLAPVSFYTVKETIGLRHPTYGRLIMDWLTSSSGATDRQLLAPEGQAAAFLDCYGKAETPVERRFRLLEPILKSLRPNASQAQFAANLSVRFLRLQKRDIRSEMNQFQWQKQDLVREAFSWLNEAVVRQSSVTLHSRAISRYKTCRTNLPLEECRRRYALAVIDLEMALERAQQQEGGEHPGNIITSLGLLYLGWAERERQDAQRPGNNDEEWKRLDGLVEKTLRAGLDERRDNPYAACGLARYLLERCSRLLNSETGPKLEQYAACAKDLSEALELLQVEPEASFASDWNDLWKQAIALLTESDAKQVIEGLKLAGDELGYALECMKLLEGRIPTEPTEETKAVQALNEADKVLLEAQQVRIAKPCPLGNLLRYAIFSAKPERLHMPAFDQRLQLLEKLLKTRYLEQPIWRFDYAMLAFQTGHYTEGAESFAWLRKGARFFEVPRERSQLLSESPQSLKPMLVTFRIVVQGAEGEKGVGRVERPVRFRDPVPFAARSFLSRGKGVRPGTVTSCYIRLNPAGPFAEPEAR